MTELGGCPAGWLPDGLPLGGGVLLSKEGGACCAGAPEKGCR